MCICHQVDGCATFFNEERFILLENVPVEFKKKGHSVLDRDNVALIMVLKMIHSRRFLALGAFLFQITTVCSPPGLEILVDLALLLWPTLTFCTTKKGEM